ncbi:MAG: VCBS repeat-containing protein, partial [Planctomycetota bacterium]
MFADVASELGIRMAYQNATQQITKQFQIHQSLGTGVACLDYDLDGRLDFYFGQGGFEPPTGRSKLSNRLFRQVGDNDASAFHDVTALADAKDFGYTHGVTSGDWNQDGLPDLFIGNLGRNQLLINQGDGQFTPLRPQREPLAAMWDRDMFTTAIAMADVTGDALPDLIEVNYIDDPKIFNPNTVDGQTLQIGPLYYDAAIDRVFYNDGKGQILSKALGKGSGLPSTGLGVLVTNVNDQPGNEILVANDLLPNHLWQIRTTPDEPSSPEWTDNAVAAGVAYATNGQPLACMGITAADFNRDGRLDLHITNYVDEWSNLYLQNQSGVFQDAAAQYALDIPTNPNVGFGTQAIDYDNNTTWDLVVGNGHTEDFSHRGIAFKMPTQVLMRSADGFVAASVQGQDDYWSSNHVARSIAR